MKKELVYPPTASELKFLTPILILLFLPACSREKNDATWWRNEKQIIELECQIELATYKLQLLQENELEAVENSSRLDLMAEIGSLTSNESRLVNQISQLQNDWEVFRVDVLSQRRAQALGKTFDTFETSDGRVYKNVIITEIGDGGVSFRHKVGTTRLRFDDLDQIRQEFFGLDADLARIALAKEDAQRAAYDRWIESEMFSLQAESAMLEIQNRKNERLANTRINTRASKVVGIQAERNSIHAQGMRTSSFNNLRNHLAPKGFPTDPIRTSAAVRYATIPFAP